MRLIEFPEQTVVIAKNQSEYRPLPAHRDSSDPRGTITCCWKPTWLDRLRIIFGKPIWHQILTFNHPLQPQLLSTVKPALSPVNKRST